MLIKNFNILGDKIASSIVAQTANVPTLPWSGSTLKLPLNESRDNIQVIKSVPDEIYKSACVDGVERALKVFTSS